MFYGTASSSSEALIICEASEKRGIMILKTPAGVCHAASDETWEVVFQERNANTRSGMERWPRLPFVVI